jgi:hypothetical protein
MTREQLDSLQSEIDEETFIAPKQIFRKRVDRMNEEPPRTFITVEPRVGSVNLPAFNAVRRTVREFVNEEFGTDLRETYIADERYL